MLTKKPIVLITGANKGIGQALAHRLADDGNRVLGLGRAKQSTNTALERYFSCDLADFVSLEAFAQQLQSDYPAIDVLIHNAAVGFYGRIEDQPDLVELLRTNTLAPILLTRLLASSLLAADHPRVVFISSVHSRFPAAQFAAYAASKCALEGFARSLREEWRDRVDVQVLLPGPTATDMQRRAGVPARVRRTTRQTDPAQVAARIAARLTGQPTRQTLFWRDRWARLAANLCAPLLDRRTLWCRR